MRRPLQPGAVGALSIRRLPLLVALALCATAGLAASSAPPLEGEAAEEFLRTATIEDFRTLERGVTRSSRATLTDGARVERAVWKTIDEYAPIKYFDDGGPPEIGFRDCYRHEIAIYEIAKLLGVGELVPPTVYRRIRRESGSLQLWIDDVMTEGERRRKGLKPPDARAWNRQMHNVRLLRSLADDRDYLNASNVLIGPDFRIWAIDFSRAFRTSREPLPDLELTRFTASVLERLRALDKKTLDDRTGRWLTRLQRQRLLERRDRIVEHAERLIGEEGEKAVLYSD